MNTVSDLAARAVSFITLIQEEYLCAAMEGGLEKTGRTGGTVKVADIFQPASMNLIRDHIDRKKQQFLKSRMQAEAAADSRNLPPTPFQERAVELVYVSTGHPRFKAAEEYTLKLMFKLAGWIAARGEALFRLLDTAGTLPTPQSWRTSLSTVLYADRQNRVSIAAALEYIPIPVVLAIGGRAWNVREQRVMQIWAADNDLPEEMLKEDMALHQKLWEPVPRDLVGQLLRDERQLAEILERNSPLPFDMVYMAELREIHRNRQERSREYMMLSGKKGRIEKKHCEAFPDTDDAQSLAREMDLYGLAFSGGGIRSATFNLGILQGFARKGLLRRFDYLSTVSGGGYIGSWLAAWIKREGSVAKVNNRLNPDKSPDPFGEEVRPIRWLRMYSNYLAPSAGLMSTDAWTIGATWLRNTLLNQFILLLLFLAVLLGLRGVFELWTLPSIWSSVPGSNSAYIAGAVALLAISILAGLCMQVYERQQHAIITDRDKKTLAMSGAIAICAMIGSLIVSAGFYTRPGGGGVFKLVAFVEKLNYLWPASLVVLASLIIIGYVGRYQRCIKAATGSPGTAHFALLGSSVVATLVSVLCLTGAWTLLQLVQTNYQQRAPFLFMDGYETSTSEIWRGFAFMIGLPLVLLTFGITVVARMALLGRYFPDDRREWWGRMGAELARTALLFMLFSGSSLIGLELVKKALASSDAWLKGSATLGGWVAVVGAAVKAAFSEKTSGKAGERPGGGSGLLLTVLSAAGPYLFALGLLVFLPALLIPLLRICQKYLLGWESWVQCLGLGALLFALAYGLARRVGVNEFSMHHFYRNRLVRAYLGATRRRTDRDRTANPYTNFDMQDDVKLSTLTSAEGYYGPYPILNTALNASQASSLDRQDRKAESFTFSPLYCGFDFSMTRSSAEVVSKSYDYGYRATDKYAYGYDHGPGIGTAMAISGAAVNPNAGYHSSPGIAFLLTVFNVQMGWWMGNPRKRHWRSADPKYGLAYILANLAGNTSTRDEYVCLSDGGHFDNMGLYELVRRRCRFIVLGDGEQDDQFSCEGLANAIRRCRIDFGVEIRIDVRKITERDDKHHSAKQYVLGRIYYSESPDTPGWLLYIKSSVNGKEPVDVQEYAQKNPSFPHQSTGDQFFDEQQFESYRRLGLHIADTALADPELRAALNLGDLPQLAPFQATLERLRQGFRYLVSRP